MTDVRTPDPTKASPSGPPDRELRTAVKVIVNNFGWLNQQAVFGLNAGADKDEAQTTIETALLEDVDSIMALISVREAALLQRVKDELPAKLLESNMGVMSLEQTQGFNQAIDSITAVLDNIIGGKK